MKESYDNFETEQSQELLQIVNDNKVKVKINKTIHVQNVDIKYLNNRLILKNRHLESIDKSPKLKIKILLESYYEYYTIPKY